MLVFIGIAASVMTEEEGGVFKATAGGYSLSLARAMRKRCPEIGFLSSVSPDIPGRVILDTLVGECIFFDPDLVDPSAGSFLRFISGSESRDYASASAPVTLKEESIVSSLASNSDIKAVHLSAEGLFYQPVCSASISAVSFHTPKPVIIIDPASSSFDHSRDEMRYRRQLREAFESASLLLLEPADLASAGLSEKDIKVPYVLFEAEHTVFSSGLIVPSPVSKAEVLGIMMEKELFGAVTEEPGFKGLENISEADFR